VALPSYTATACSLQFIDSNGTVELAFSPAQIGTVSGGPSDLLLGAYQTLYVPDHPTSYDITLGAPIKPGVYALSSTPVTLATSVNPLDYSAPGKVLITGQVTAKLIDFNTGSVTWNDVTGLTTTNTLASATLTDFSRYGVGSLSTAFATDSALRNWIGSPTGTITRGYSATLTATPEPAVWALWIVGTLLAGGMFWRSRTLHDSAIG
jgi:hypothetical protein